MIQKNKVMFPTRIKILDQFYKIIYIEKLSEMDENGIKTMFGETNFQRKIIRVYRPPECSIGEVWNTIMHEAIHVIFETLKIGDGDEKLNEDAFQEKVIHLLATGINTMMIDNDFYFQKIDS